MDLEHHRCVVADVARRRHQRRELGQASLSADRRELALTF
jgi:hypothetical protein